MVALWAAIVAMSIGRPAEAERWADAVDRRQHDSPARVAEPVRRPVRRPVR